MALRVVHVVRKLDPGGVETWLLQLINYFDRSRCLLDVAVTSNEAGAFNEKFRAQGVKIHKLGSPRNPIRLQANFSRINKLHGPYQVLHSHLHHFSGVMALIAAREGIPHRITHSHSDTRTAPTGLGRIAYLRIMKWLVNRYGTLHLAVGEGAASALHGSKWRESQNVVISRCGVDFGRFMSTADARGLRSSLGIPEGSLVLGTAGRLVPVKNQTFMIEVRKRVLERQPNSYLVIVGDGPLRNLLQAKAKSLVVEGRLRLLGPRIDVPEILANVFDLFLLTSIYEGLPLSVLEAQAAGLPCIISRSITKECIVVQGLVQMLDLEAGPERWALEVFELSRSPRTGRTEALSTMVASDFSIHKNVKQLSRYYSALFSSASREANLGHFSTCPVSIL